MIVYSSLFSTKQCLGFLLICFAREIKGSLSWFQGHNERFPKYLGWKLKSQKTETEFCRWKSTDNNNINTFLSLENPCTFFLAKEKTWKRIFNTNSELLQIHKEKQIMPSKTTINWLFNDIWCSLFITFFDSNIDIFQQTFVRVYYILNWLLFTLMVECWFTI